MVSNCCVLRSAVDLDPHGSPVILVGWMQIQIQEAEISSFVVLDVIFCSFVRGRLLL